MSVHDDHTSIGALHVSARWSH